MQYAYFAANSFFNQIFLQVGAPLTYTVLDTHGANGSTNVTYKCKGSTNSGNMVCSTQVLAFKL